MKLLPDLLLRNPIKTAMYSLMSSGASTPPARAGPWADSHTWDRKQEAALAPQGKSQSQMGPAKKPGLAGTPGSFRSISLFHLNVKMSRLLTCPKTTQTCLGTLNREEGKRSNVLGGQTRPPGNSQRGSWVFGPQQPSLEPMASPCGCVKVGTRHGDTPCLSMGSLDIRDAVLRSFPTTASPGDVREGGPGFCYL